MTEQTEYIHPADSVVFDESMDAQDNVALQVIRHNRVLFLRNAYSAPEDDTIRVRIQKGLVKFLHADLTVPQTKQLLAPLQGALAARRP